MDLEKYLFGYSDRTKKLLIGTENIFERTTGKTLARASYDDIARFLTEIEEKRKPRTLIAYISRIEAILKLLGRRDLAEELRTQSRRFRKKKFITGGGVYVPYEQWESLLKACTSLKERAIVATLLYTGIRLSELLSIKVSDVNLKERYITLEKRKFSAGKEGGTVAVPKPLAKILEAYIKKVKKEGDSKLFDVAPRTVQTMVKKVAERAGLSNWKDITPHKLRHSFVIACMMAEREGKIDLEAVRRQAGWTDAGKMIKTYADYGVKELVEAYDNVFS